MRELGQSEAERDLRPFGWKPTSADDLLIEGVSGRDFQLGRAWSTAGSYETLPSAGSVYILLAVEGTSRMANDDGEVLVGPNEMIILHGENLAHVTLTSPTARYIWRFDPGLLSDRRVSERLTEPLRVDPSAWKPVANLTNALLTAAPDYAAKPQIGAVSHTLLTALLEGDQSTADRSAPPDQLFSRAMEAIRIGHPDPGLRVKDIARAVSASESTLRRAFAVMGTTVRREVEATRCRTLVALLRTRPAPTPREYRELLERSGFRDRAQARAALHRHGY